MEIQKDPIKMSETTRGSHGQGRTYTLNNHKSLISLVCDDKFASIQIIEPGAIRVMRLNREF